MRQLAVVSDQVPRVVLGDGSGYRVLQYRIGCFVGSPRDGILQTRGIDSVMAEESEGSTVFSVYGLWLECGRWRSLRPPPDKALCACC
jgi:hypothetical protein